MPIGFDVLKKKTTYITNNKYTKSYITKYYTKVKQFV